MTMTASGVDSSAHTVVLAGELDAACAAELREMLRRKIDVERRTNFDIDVSDVSFIDSTALGVLFGIHCRVRAHGGRVRLVHASAPIKQVLAVTGLDKHLAGDATL